MSVLDATEQQPQALFLHVSRLVYSPYHHGLEVNGFVLTLDFGDWKRVNNPVVLK